MSDGNFNRALLPHTPYASGLKAGKSMARMKALEAFEEWLSVWMPQLSEQEKQEQKDAFHMLLTRKLGI